jgi:hypothetical protein
MQISGISVQESPFAKGRVRISANVSYNRSSLGRETCWYDFPEQLIPGYEVSGNPWLAAHLPLAMTLGEPIRISAPVDRHVFEGAQQVLEIWHSWYPELPIIPIETEVADPPVPLTNRGERTAAFFSGGVDSFFTLLMNTDPTNTRRIPIDDLLLVWGFDVCLKNESAFRRLRGELTNAASGFEIGLSDVATNLRETHFRMAKWGQLAHGAALVSVGLHLEKKHRVLLIPSSGGYKELLPWGSHVLTDPLFSTSRMKVVQDGASFSRGQKLERIAGCPLVQRYLRVCWRSGTDRNCGNCGKCLRALIALEVLGCRERFTSFPPRPLDLATIARIYYDDRHMIDRGWDLHNLVLRKGRPDIARAIERSLKRSMRLQRWSSMTRSLHSKRLVWRWADWLERWVVAGSIV